MACTMRGRGSARHSLDVLPTTTVVHGVSASLPSLSHSPCPVCYQPMCSGVAVAGRGCAGVSFSLCYLPAAADMGEGGGEQTQPLSHAIFVCCSGPIRRPR